MKVFLDDVRSAPDGWVLVRTVKDAINALKTGRVLEISLDHDLGTAYSSGYDVLNWIEHEVAKGWAHPPLIHIHTMNPVARTRMEAAVRQIERFLGRAHHTVGPGR
jgi:hypothetical protein